MCVTVSGKDAKWLRQQMSEHGHESKGLRHMTFTEFGALIGFFTGVFTLVDRLLMGRPTTMVRRNVGRRELQCVNASKLDIIITHIRTSSKYVLVARGEDVASVGDAFVRNPFTMIIPAGEQANLPIMVTDGALVEKDATNFEPFVIVVSWRKTRSMWLPQVPAFIFSSIRALRRLDAAKSAKPRPHIA
jgi:hypothetical protein